MISHVIIRLAREHGARRAAAQFRPVPGKFCVELVQNKIVKVRSYGKDASGDYIEVQRAGSYRATERLPLTCIRRLTDDERRELGTMVDQGFF